MGREGEEVTRNKNITCKEYSHAKRKNDERYGTKNEMITEKGMNSRQGSKCQSKCQSKCWSNNRNIIISQITKKSEFDWRLIGGQSSS